MFLKSTASCRCVHEGTVAALAGWKSLDGNISVIHETVPVSSALLNALQLSLLAGEANGIGFANSGYFRYEL